MHDTVQLQKCCLKDKDISRSSFLGVFAADQIPKTLPQNCCFIANTDPIAKEGTHWIAFLSKGSRQIFFDSYGEKPFFKRFDNWERSREDYQQQTSDVCGDYCLFALKRLSTLPEPSVQRLLKNLNPHDEKENDILICQTIHRLFPKILCDTKHRSYNKTLQCCKSRK